MPKVARSVFKATVTNPSRRGIWETSPLGVKMEFDLGRTLAVMSRASEGVGLV